MPKLLNQLNHMPCSNCPCQDHPINSCQNNCSSSSRINALCFKFLCPRHSQRVPAKLNLDSSKLSQLSAHSSNHNSAILLGQSWSKDILRTQSRMLKLSHKELPLCAYQPPSLTPCSYSVTVMLPLYTTQSTSVSNLPTNQLSVGYNISSSTQSICAQQNSINHLNQTAFALRVISLIFVFLFQGCPLFQI